MKRGADEDTDNSPSKKCAVGDSATFLDAAVRAVTHASSIAMHVQSKNRCGGGGAIEKNDTSPVTVADFAVQCFVTLYLAVATGAGDSLRLVAEEDADLLKDGSRDLELQEVAQLLNEHFPFKEVARLFPQASSPSSFTKEDVISLLHRGNDAGGREGSFWVLDPIDGTKGFIRDAQYALGLGFVDRGVPVLGAMSCPNLPKPGGNVEHRAEDAGFVFFSSGSQASVLGLSACSAKLTGDSPDLGIEWHKLGSPLHVAPPCELKAAVLCESYESAHRDGDAIIPQLCKKNVLSTDSLYRLDSMSKYGLVARGDAHIYLRGSPTCTRSEKIWDHAPGVAIVLAAGGRVTDLSGNPLDFGCGRELSANKGILAAPQGVHEGVLSEIALLKSSAPAESK